MVGKQNPEQRRRDLCDAAITLLADDGVKGVSHLKVDRKAGVPDGTTSFYFRTSAALLCGVAARIADLDLADLRTATESPTPDNTHSAASGLAALVMRSGRGQRLIRSKARFELAMPSSRDPHLAEAFFQHQQQFFELHRDVVGRLAPTGTDSGLVDEQATVLMLFISGLMQAIARGERIITSTAQLEGVIVSIVDGMTANPRDAKSTKQSRPADSRRR
jgi:DNA-binding transcriptional regulator YbjK